jgi:arylsulfatase A-like enzyme
MTMNHHVILLSLDALRPDGLGCYGNPRSGVSANLDRMVEEDQCLLFLNATTPATWTLPAHMSMLSGLEPPVHGCVSPRHRYPPQTLPFPLAFELLEQAGYASLAVTGGGYMEAQFGFGRGAREFEVILPIAEALRRVVDHASQHERSFCFFHTYTVHDYPRVASSPKLLKYVQQRDPGYDGYFSTDQDFNALITALGTSADTPPIGPRDLAYIRDIYDASVNITDSSLGAFFWALKEADVLRDTTLIFTSDHGESLGEQHMGIRHWHHAGSPYQDQLHVPLVIRPAQHLLEMLEPGPVEEPVSLLDLVPTLLDLAEQPFSREQFDGTSLVDLSLGQVAAFETRRLFFHSCEDPGDRYLDQRLYGAALTWRDNSKLFYDPRTRALRELYWLDRDPGEADNRIDDLDHDEMRRVAATIEDYWASVERRAREPRALQIDDPSVLERLEALGYINA